MSDRAKIQEAIEIAWNYAGFDGGHHKQWVIDQMVRALTGTQYKKWVRQFCKGDDGPETYSWDEGIPP